MILKEKNDLTFWEHLDDLRLVLWQIIIAFLFFLVIAILSKDFIFNLLLAPKENDFITYRLINSISRYWGLGGHAFNIHVPNFKIINATVSGQFLSHMSVSLYVALITLLPYVIYKLFNFISPALYENEKKYAKLLVTWGYLLFSLGVLMGFFIIFPLSLRFLVSYTISAEVTNTILLNSYINTILLICLFCGVIFEIPITAWLLAKFNLISSEHMLRYRKHFVVIALIISAIITPTTDIATLIIVTFPMIVLYEISILLIRFTSKSS